MFVEQFLNLLVAPDAAHMNPQKMMFYPLRVMQGGDLHEARVYMMAKFPLMGVGYGPNAAKAV